MRAGRGWCLLCTGQALTAEEALQCGVVGEVVPNDDLLPRAWELAETVLMSRGRIQRRLTRALLIQPWRELLVREIGLGMATECLAAAAGDPDGLRPPDRQASGQRAGDRPAGARR
jgi:enoyl-CoA hydratase/carnithine racemase